MARVPRIARGGRGQAADHHGFVGNRGGRAAGRGRGRAGRGETSQALTMDMQIDQQQHENHVVVPGNAQPIVTADSLMASALAKVGFAGKRQDVRLALNLQRFRAFFGVGPKALAALFNDLIDRNETDFLITMNWLKLYDTEHVLSGRWGLHEETIRQTVKKYVAKMAALQQSKIMFGGFDDDEIYIISLDGVHCQIREPRTDPGSQWYDHKTNSAGVAYELAVAIRSDRLVHIRGPFPASTHDITIFRGGKKGEPKDADALIHKIPVGKKAIGDSGYKGEPDKIAVSREGDTVEVKKFKARMKARHETFNGRLKSFGILDQPFRHKFHLHGEVFIAVCVAVQYDLENGHGLFEA